MFLCPSKDPATWTPPDNDLKPQCTCSLPAPTPTPARGASFRTFAEVSHHLGENLGCLLDVCISWLWRSAIYSVVKEEVLQPQFSFLKTEGLWFPFCRLNSGACLWCGILFIPLCSTDSASPHSSAAAFILGKHHQRTCIPTEYWCNSNIQSSPDTDYFW